MTTTRIDLSGGTKRLGIGHPRGRIERIEAALAEMPAARGGQAGEGPGLGVGLDHAPQSAVDEDDQRGFQPAYNIRFAADTADRVIVGMEVTNVGSDMEQAPGMVEQVEERSEQLPNDWLMDGGFANRSSIEKVESQGVRVLAPVQAPKDPERDPHEPLPEDSPTIACWRGRIGTEEAKVTYRARASTVELANAQARAWHGLTQL